MLLQTFDHRSLIEASEFLTHSAFIPGIGVATASSNGTVFIWDSKEQLVCTRKGMNLRKYADECRSCYGILSMVASRDGRILVLSLSAVQISRVKFFDVTTCRLVAVHVCNGKQELAAAVIGVDGSVAIGCRHDVYLWERRQILENNGTYKHPYEMEQIAQIVRTRANDGDGKVSSVTLNADSSMVMVGHNSLDGYATLWDIGTGKVVRRYGETLINEIQVKYQLLDHPWDDEIGKSACHVRISGSKVLIGAQFSVTLWDILSGNRLCYIHEDEGHTLAIEFDDIGDRILVNSWDKSEPSRGVVRLYDVASCFANNYSLSPSPSPSLSSYAHRLGSPKGKGEMGKEEKSHQTQREGQRDVKVQLLAIIFVAVVALAAIAFLFFARVWRIRAQSKKQKISVDRSSELNQNTSTSVAPVIAAQSSNDIDGLQILGQSEIVIDGLQIVGQSEVATKGPQIGDDSEISALMHMHSGRLSSCTFEWNVVFQTDMHDVNLYGLIKDQSERTKFQQVATTLVTSALVPEVIFGPLLSGIQVTFDVHMSPASAVSTDHASQCVSITLEATSRNGSKRRKKKKERKHCQMDKSDALLANIAEDDSDLSCSSATLSSSSSSSSTPPSERTQHELAARTRKQKFSEFKRKFASSFDNQSTSKLNKEDQCFQISM
eukprot:gnl/MRDRNA2_/MRDRNA2_85672_c0_seq1.p1 gnl/MRDRNA2_/MRDRNA2_85672_c0~~gnl/MRDRNA2_/MRDRNA2_85672_c0_seq1.p1  ORF type:complete len:676 (+),score=81.93 gnl/MRDRNA2_/MRDRNA2_85672_c0_seq1:40-2028(+)